jgi:hypothetical protein
VFPVRYELGSYIPEDAILLQVSHFVNAGMAKLRSVAKCELCPWHKLSRIVSWYMLHCRTSWTFLPNRRVCRWKQFLIKICATGVVSRSNSEFNYLFTEWGCWVRTC